jgi:predicted DNA-binding protein
MSKNKDISGKFASKSKTSRKICSVNLTDETWQRLAAMAKKTGKSRNDFLESLLKGNNPFMETVAVQTQPLMEVVLSETETDGANIMQPTSWDELREKLKDKEWRVQMTLGTYRPTT